MAKNEKHMTKITLLGGTFDPPHFGHSRIAQALLEQNLADQVWFLPVGEHAFDKKASPAAVRTEMLKRIQMPKTRIELYEVEQQGMSITYETLCALAEKYSNYQFSFVIGSDNLQQFHQWHHYEEMLARFPFFVYPREGFALAPLYPGMKVLEGVEPVTVSSTQVRQCVKNDQSTEGLIKPAVAEYIKVHGLYK